MRVQRLIRAHLDADQAWSAPGVFDDPKIPACAPDTTSDNVIGALSQAPAPLHKGWLARVLSWPITRHAFLIAAAVVLFPALALAGCNGENERADRQGEPNSSHEITEEEYIEEASSIDSDKDGFSNLEDNCPAVANPDQSDADGDEVGTACDECPDQSAPGYINGCPDRTTMKHD